MQERYHTVKRADAFYSQQMLTALNAEMTSFIGKQAMVFVATADSQGECDASARFGPPGFVEVLDEHHLAWPEYRGNGVMASLGNIEENPHVGLLFIDFFESTVGLHVNGTARVLPNGELSRLAPADDPSSRPEPERWVWLTVEEAYMHCSKHVPHLARLEKRIAWGTDDAVQKGGDFFHAKTTAKEVVHGRR